jgi:acetoacetyl-CoA synthetase
LGSAAVSEGELLWRPTEARKAESNVAAYLRWLSENRGLDFGSYDELWRWSVADLEGFWSSIWDYFQVKARRPFLDVLAGRGMPGARWFVGAELNYAEHVFARRDSRTALIFRSERRPTVSISYGDLYRQTAAVAAGLRRLGVKPGDRVVAYMPNIPEAVVAFLACASIGAVWSSCSPDFGFRSVVDRFRQIEPRVLFAVDGYQYGGTPYNRLETVAEIERRLPTLEATVLISYLDEDAPADGLRHGIPWRDLEQEAEDLDFEPLPFSHPLWVVYSSGTTGLPKAIVHGHGGILLEHLKVLSFHMDIGTDDRFFWFTTTGWIMWNLVVGALMLGASVLLYDGSPGYPDMGFLWRLAEETRMTYFGVSAPYILSCMKAKLEPRVEADMSGLRAVGSTGAPLSPQGFQWVYEKVKRDLILGSTSGGTDIASAFVGSCPLLPVHAGEIQCRCLGVAVDAYNDHGQSLIGELGELVVRQPMPSMPLFLWGDIDDRLYKESYFDVFPGIWRHGDWIKITDRGSCVIPGRSDSTLKRAGVRMGTSEFYQVVEELPEVLDSLIIDTSELGREGQLLLFVVLTGGESPSNELITRIRDKIRLELSPRHIPDQILGIPEVPRTLNGKKLEVPVRRILTGMPPRKAANPDAMSNPKAIDPFVELAQLLKAD